jgi:hypothetical protein
MIRPLPPHDPPEWTITVAMPRQSSIPLDHRASVVHMRPRHPSGRRAVSARRTGWRHSIGARHAPERRPDVDCLLFRQSGVLSRRQALRWISDARLRHLVGRRSPLGRLRRPGPSDHRRRVSATAGRRGRDARRACAAAQRTPSSADHRDDPRRGDRLGVDCRARLPAAMPARAPSRPGATKRDGGQVRPAAIRDAYFDEFNVHVEIDGGQHTDVREWWADMRRQNAMGIHGRRVLRFPAWALRHDSNRVIADLRAALIAAGWRT